MVTLGHCAAPAHAADSSAQGPWEKEQGLKTKTSPQLHSSTLYFAPGCAVQCNKWERSEVRFVFWGLREVPAPALHTIAELAHGRQGGSTPGEAKPAGLFQQNNEKTGSPLTVNAFGAQ